MRNNETINFSYDHLDRLDHAWSGLFEESFAYTNIGTFQTRTNFSYSYPSAGSARPHAPTSVNGNAYTHDSNGNLTGAEGRTYDYDLENRLVAVLENGQTILSFTYDGDGVLRTMVQGGQTIHYVSPDYRVNPATGEITVYYRFGGRAVAYGNNGGLKYLLSDHLSSTQGEVSASQSDVGERRYMPLGGLRAVSGIGDIADEEGFTSQRRIDGGNGNARRELYYYGARWYLPGVGIFTQPDTVVPDYKNPQALNRYSYGYNNPVKYVDPTGHDPLDSDWENAFRQAHGGNDPTDADRIDRLNSVLLSNGGAWNAADWQRYTQAKQSGAVDPMAVLKGTSGSLDQRINLASALVTLATSGAFGSALYQSYIGGGGTVQYGGGPFRQGGTAIGYDNHVYLDEGWQSWGAEMTAAFIAHEAYHAQQSAFRYPYTRNEEVQAFTQQARAWSELRTSYSGAADANWARQETILIYSQRPGGLRFFVDADPFYNQWFYLP